MERETEREKDLVRESKHTQSERGGEGVYAKRERERKGDGWVMLSAVCS